MPRGGARVGAGRKKKETNVVGFPGGGAVQTSAPPTPPVPAEARALEEPPADLPEEQQKVWRIYAPLAVEQRTLVPTTVPGFRELCRLVAFADKQADRVDKFGSDVAMKHYQKLAAHVRASLMSFKLTAFGKPADGGGAKKSAAANPWSMVAGQ